MRARETERWGEDPADLILYRRRECSTRAAEIVRTPVRAHRRASSYGFRIYTAGNLYRRNIDSREGGFPAPSVSGTTRGEAPRLCSAACIIDSVGARLSFVSRPRPRLDNICAYAQINTHRVASLARNRAGGCRRGREYRSREPILINPTLFQSERVRTTDKTESSWLVNRMYLTVVPDLSKIPD